MGQVFMIREFFAMPPGRQEAQPQERPMRALVEL